MFKSQGDFRVKVIHTEGEQDPITRVIMVECVTRQLLATEGAQRTIVQGPKQAIGAKCLYRKWMKNPEWR